MNMVEQVARALYVADSEFLNEEKFMDVIDNSWPQYADLAKAAIKAMQKPTKEMISAGESMYDRDEVCTVRADYGAMMRAALEGSN